MLLEWFAFFNCLVSFFGATFMRTTVTLALGLCSGEDDTSRMHSAAGTGQREERRPAGHGPHSQLP